MGAWIETQLNSKPLTAYAVAPVWVRGLKHGGKSMNITNLTGRTRMGAWIET